MAQNVKTVNSLAVASCKTISGLAIASAKTIMGVDNEESITPPYSPMIWLEGDSVNDPTNGQNVTTWSDKSGNGNDFTTAGASPPVFAAAAINGLGAVDFNGSDTVLTRAISATQEFTVFYVGVFDAVADNKSIIGARSSIAGSSEALYVGTTTGSTSRFRRGVGTGTTIIAASGASGDYVAGTWRYVSGRSTGTTATDIAQWMGEVAKGTASSASVPKSADILSLGAGYHNQSIVDYTNGKIACFIFYNSALTDLQIRDVGDYIYARFGNNLVPEWVQETSLDANSGAIDSIAFDLDGDGDDELIAIASSSSADPSFRIYKWDGAAYVNVKDVLSSAQVNAMDDRFGTRIACADIDDDGEFEIVVVDSSNAGNTGTLFYYKHDGSITGTWTETAVDTWSNGEAGDAITHAECVCGDLLQAGKQDIVVRDISHGVWVFPNTTSTPGTATFGTRKFIATNPREGLTLADIYGNGRLDIVLNGVVIETPSNLASGTFTIHPVIGMEDWYPAGSSSDEIADYACQVVVGDLDGGGQMIVISNAEELNHASATKPLGIKAYIRPADPINDAWTETDLINTDFSWHTLVLRDIEGTGNLSVLSGISSVGADTASGRITWWPGNGDGTFGSATDIETGTFVYSGCLGTLSGETILFAPENWNSGAIRAFRKR